MKERSNLYSILKSFYMEIKTQFDALHSSINVFQSDNAHEYFHIFLFQFFFLKGFYFNSFLAMA